MMKLIAALVRDFRMHTQEKVNCWVNPLSNGQHAVHLGPCEQVLSIIKQCNLSQVNLGNVLQILYISYI